MSRLASAAGFVAALIGLVSSCNIDDRVLTGGVARPSGGDASIGVVPGAPGGGGNGPGAGVLGVDPPAFDFGPSVVGSPSRTRVAVRNGGDGALAATAASFAAGSDADYLVLLNQCESELPPEGRCEVRVQLVPSESGASTATLGIASGGQSAQVALAASGVASGPLTLAPSAGSSANFGGVVLDTSAEMSFDVSNPSADASGPLAFSVNDAQFELQAAGEGDCQAGATALGPGQRCRLRLLFTPERRGPVDASLVVTSALGASSLALSGVGSSPASLNAPATVDFGGVVLGGTALRTLRLGNAGDEPLVLGGLALAGAAPAPVPGGDAGQLAQVMAAAPGSDPVFSIQSSDCGAGMALAGGQECTLSLGFRPLVATADQRSLVVISAANGSASQIALSGSGLNQGALVLEPASGGPATFDELLVGDSQTLQFVVTNPSAQLSGPLDVSTSAVSTSDDFVVLPSAADGDCEVGVTSLVNGESCVVNVAFAPRERGQRDGSLLVSSALGGAVFRPLSGRGLAPARLELPRAELDFGRVQAETPVLQTLAIVNSGDQPISVLQATLEAPGGGPAQGFSLLGACGAVAADVPCELGVQFSPPQAASYAAVLRVAGDTGTAASALLLGRAFPRGSLVLTAAAGATDFGDVALGSSRGLDFTLTNPGSVASGRLTLATSSNAFAVSEGDCNPEGSAGLIDGSSCTFSVTFTPTTSDALSVSLSVQSPGAGETALSLTGRGRTAPSLTATGNRDFGSANVAEQALTNPTNQFTWTVTNGGDLATGVLAVDNTNAAEFIVSNDTCANVSLPGGGTCSLDIRFLPSGAGARSASLTVTDTVSSQALVLAMTGNGTVIANPGEPCIDACAGDFICTGGVCCDRECVGSCQACSAAGVCTDQAERQPCGDGSGVCFGVDRCLLPEREACSGNDQCGSGNCELRLGGQGPADLICCLDDCGTTGQQCAPDTGRCQVPALGAGQACGAAGQAACGAGLECKACLSGGSQCTPADACCGGCPGDQVCVGGECACPTPPGALQEIHCGSGRCISNVAGACCDTATGCDGDLQCNAATDSCACPAGSRECSAGSGTCVPNDQCCNCGGLCDQCVNGQCSAIGDGQTGRCTGGQVCQNRACADLRDAQLGEPCSQAAGNCAAGACNELGICDCAASNDPQRCGDICIGADACCDDSSCTDVPCGVCNAQRVCEGCSGGLECQGGVCQAPPPPVLAANGDPCALGTECMSGSCEETFVDNDGDGFAPAGAEGQTLCTPADGRTTRPPVEGSLDCCDVDGGGEVHQGQTVASATPVAACAANDRGFDRDCSGAGESPNANQNREQRCDDTTVASCTARGGYVIGSTCGENPEIDPNGTIPPCGGTGCIGGCGDNGFETCGGTPGGPSLRTCL